MVNNFEQKLNISEWVESNKDTFCSLIPLMQVILAWSLVETFAMLMPLIFQRLYKSSTNTGCRLKHSLIFNRVKIDENISLCSLISIDGTLHQTVLTASFYIVIKSWKIPPKYPKIDLICQTKLCLKFCMHSNSFYICIIQLLFSVFPQASSNLIIIGKHCVNFLLFQNTDLDVQ